VGGVDLSMWDAVMSRHVRKAAQFGIPIHVVDYPRIAGDLDFHSFIYALSTADLTSLTRNESFALGINAYNAFAIKTLIDYACQYENMEEKTGACLGATYGVPGIKVGNSSGFKLKIHNLAGELYSLDEVEQLMRPVPSPPLFSYPIDTTEDLRIHAALVCDGTSCPNLALEAFTPESIDSQMDAAVVDWMANPFKGLHINKATNVVQLSKIFTWFKDEFDAQGGMENAYRQYMPPAAQAYFASGVKYTVEYLGYMWDANGPVPCSCQAPVMSNVDTEATCHVQ